MYPVNITHTWPRCTQSGSGTEIGIMPMNEKKADIIRYIKQNGPFIISYSGGVDSSLLAALADLVHGEKTCCIFLDSGLVSKKMIEQAKKRANELGIEYEVIRLPVIDDPEFRKNPKNRCYICKKLSSELLNTVARSRGYSGVADGVNITDLSEFRPGLVACREEGILHPFADCGISKEDIRAIAEECGYSFWDAPSGTCLATRIPYGDEITPALLRKIEEAEEAISACGCSVVRVRAYEALAKIEVLPAEFPRILADRESIIARFRKIGFEHVTLDLEGYRSGSMDEPDR